MSLPSTGGKVDAGQVSASPEVPEVRSLIKKPGDTIRSEDWNRLVTELIALREYVNNMSESVTLTGLVSRTGQSLALDTVNPPGSSYGARAVGLITTQWVTPMPANVGEICAFGITDHFETVQFWAGADNGDKNALDIVLEYVDGTMSKTGDNLFVNSRATLTEKAGNNRYSEYLRAPIGYWYKYQIRNRAPDKEVRSIRFVNVNKECVVRIGNVLHLRTRIKPFE